MYLYANETKNQWMYVIQGENLINMHTEQGKQEGEENISSALELDEFVQLNIPTSCSYCNS